MKKRTQRIILYSLLAVTAVGILWLTTSRTDEQQYLEFNVQGRLVDKQNAVADAQVMLLLRHDLLEDRQLLFTRQKIKRSFQEQFVYLGIADNDGVFKVQGRAQYGRRSSMIPNVFRTDTHPFKQVWLLVKKAGDEKIQILELDASQWQSNPLANGRPLIQLGDLAFNSIVD
ncbi:MAG: hypothetical protein OCC45_00645 [Desulfotalea sp.]